ncbi:MAG: TonB-dependent receptor [Williamsia sp.]|nr:TonB-dependent receptor [Williamsia sp.]
MNQNTRFLLFLFLLFPALLPAQDAYLISGKVYDSTNSQVLAGASIRVKGSSKGTASKADGAFELKVTQKLPITLLISYVGYNRQEFVVANNSAAISISLHTEDMYTNQVVVTASRVPESILQSPVAIEKLSLRTLKESPAPSFYDALENVKGVQMTTSSLTFKVPNTRGFNIPNNFRFVQLVDGVDMQAATLGVPLGNAIGPTELDVESVEIVPGASSALYGMNAINGMANLLTKSPFTYQGLSVYHKTGINHVDGKDHDPSILTETAIRYAKAFNNRWAFKINASYMQGIDWRSTNTTDQNTNDLSTANPSIKGFAGGAANNPAYDAWNKYGDESNNAVTITGVRIPGGSANQSIILRRTGYWEGDLANPRVDNLKVDAALHYRFNKNTELSYSYRVGKMDGLFQRGNKIQLDNVLVQNHKLELKGNHFFVRTYMSVENTGDSYNLKPLADNLDLTNLSNSAWGAKFKSTLQAELDKGTAIAEAARIARTQADLGRVLPGTTAFENLKNTITKINNWDHKNAGIAGAPETGGAWLHQLSRTYHADAQWDLSDKTKVVDLLLGADARIYEITPDGNNFVDFSRPVAERNTPLPDGSFGKHVFYKKWGAFVQVTKRFFDENLKLSASLRGDYNPEFDPKLNPRVAAVYTLKEKHNFRVSFQNGFRFPALFEALSFVNNGNVRRVGGLSLVNEGLGYLENSYTLASVNTFNAAVNRDVSAGTTAADAALKNKGLLEITRLAPTRPERINSFEAGYKSVLLNNKLVIDIDAYTNQYDGFLGQVEVAVPSSGKVGTDASATDMLAANRSKQTRYRVYTNAKNKYNNYGAAAGITYNFYQKYTVSGNVNYNKIKSNATKDIFVTGFNTPDWSTNVSFGNRAVAKNLGFNVVWRWQNGFYWESPLANGAVPAYYTVDAQATWSIPQWKTVLKAGGSNILNRRYYQYAAGPNISGLYYLAITLDLGAKYDKQTN